jgi:DNA-binding response OmpR family regulator
VGRGVVFLQKKTILLVDDEPEILELLETYLVRESFKVITAENGNYAIEYAKIYNPDLIVLDVMLPQLDGMEVCRILRSTTQSPIIFLSAKSDEFSKVLGLSLGGDDYVTKPFSPRELVARIKANLRRPTALNSQVSTLTNEHNKLDEPDHETIITKNKAQLNFLIFPGLKIDIDGYRVWVNNQVVKLPVKEFELLRFLAAHPNKVVSKEKLYDEIWGTDSLGDSRTVMVHMSRLREKLEKDTSLPPYLKTVWGIGYSFELPDTSKSVMS